MKILLSPYIYISTEIDYKTLILWKNPLQAPNWRMPSTTIKIKGLTINRSIRMMCLIQMILRNKWGRIFEQKLIAEVFNGLLYLSPPSPILSLMILNILLLFLHSGLLMIYTVDIFSWGAISAVGSIGCLCFARVLLLMYTLGKGWHSWCIWICGWEI